MSAVVRAQTTERLRVVLGAVAWPALTENPAGPVVVDSLGVDMPRETVEIGLLVGELSIPSIRATAHPTQDDWTVEVLVTTAVPGRTRAQAESRAAALIDALVGALAANPTLSGAVPGLLWCVPSGRLAGPRAFTFNDGGASGIGAQCSITLDCQSHFLP